MRVTISWRPDICTSRPRSPWLHPEDMAKCLLLVLQAARASLWGGAEALAVASGPGSEDLRYLKSSALQLWLLG